MDVCFHNRTHFMKNYWNTMLGNLPCRFTASHTAANYVDWFVVSR